MRKLKLREGTDTAVLFGHHDQHLKLIEHELGVRLSARGEEVTLGGLPDGVRQAERILLELASLTHEGIALQSEDVTHALNALRQAPEASLKDALGSHAAIVTRLALVVIPLVWRWIKERFNIRSKESLFGPTGESTTTN